MSTIVGRSPASATWVGAAAEARYPAMASSSRTTSAALSGRSPGSLASRRSTSSPSRPGMPGRTASTRGGSSESTRLRVSTGLAPRNGERPVSIS